MNSKLRLENQDFCFLGKNSNFKGEWQLNGPCFISGTVEGTILMNENSPLTLEREGTFKGNFLGNDFHIYGRFIGKIKSSATVTIHTNSEVDGTIEAVNLVVHPGAWANIDIQTGH